MKQKKLTRTVKLPLQTSNEKNEHVQEAIDRWQDVLRYAYEASASFNAGQRKVKHSSSMYRLMGEQFDDHNGLYSGNITEVVSKVGTMWDSWYSNGGGSWDDRPRYNDDNNSYIGVRGDYVDVRQSDGVYGIQLGMLKGQKEWFRIMDAPYHREYLDRMVDEEDSLSFGFCEVHKKGDTVWAHLSCSEQITVREPDDVTTFVGIDLNLDPIYAGCVWDTQDGVVNDFFPSTSGEEFRHYRDRLSDKLKRLQEDPDVPSKAVEDVGGHRLRYTDQVLDTCTREIVDTASEYAPCVIVMEDLTKIREDIDSFRVHEWPFADFKAKLEYKAHAAGISVVDVNPEYTSQKCHKCGERDMATRSYGGDKRSFYCERCDYGPGADSDFNAAVNIAKTGFQDSL